MSRAWMPLYVADYLADTGHLSTVEHGAYLLLIMHYWQTGGLPCDDIRLARIARLTPDEWAASRQTVQNLFDDDWKHGRIEKELADAKTAYERRAAAGRKGGNAKAASKHDDAKAIPKEQQCSSNARAGLKQSQSQSPILELSDDNSKSSDEKSDLPKRSKPSYDPEFEDAWRQYPTDANMSKAKAFEAWKRLNDQDRQSLRASIPHFQAYCRHDATYRPVHMVRFITDRRFDGFKDGWSPPKADLRSGGRKTMGDVLRERMHFDDTSSANGSGRDVQLLPSHRH